MATPALVFFAGLVAGAALIARARQRQLRTLITSTRELVAIANGGASWGR
jgi:hypothetical protein